MGLLREMMKDQTRGAFAKLGAQVATGHNFNSGDIGRDTMSSILVGRAMREAREERDYREDLRREREEERRQEREEDERQARIQAYVDAKMAREEAEWKRHHPDFAAYCKDDFQKIEEPEFDPDDNSIADMFKTLEEI